MKKPEGLLPVKLSTKIVAVPNTIGKTKREDLIATKDGRIICENLPVDWMQYILSAINSYEELQTYSRNSIPVSQGVICVLKIMGKPVAMSDGKQIKRDADGNFTLSASKEYAQRIREVLKQKKEILFGTTVHNIDFPVHVKCVFYLNKNNAQICVPEMTLSTLDLIKRLGILKKTTADVVARTDGSEVKYILNEPYTSVTIRRMKESENEETKRV